MAEGVLFEGPFFDRVLAQEPLLGATFFNYGTCTMLFEKAGRIYRLTREGCGHQFLVAASERRVPHVARVIYDYGAVAPSDEGAGEFYWLAEVERLVELDPADARVSRLQAALDSIADRAHWVLFSDLPALIQRCHLKGLSTPEFRGLLSAWGHAARFGVEFGADVDLSTRNVMLRPHTGEWVISAPLGGSFYPVGGQLDS
ncbi:hypothetical protein [Pseudomonas sp. NPDC007930]|uniref:hypothetical protein n=1 Tax=Pseudomonas sp. NPDC007930 TaxID=3364417 RepID=UPI0036E2F64A